jgi:pilus assembly protein CpaB
MKRSRIIVLVIALAAGGVAAMLASGNRTPEAPTAPPPPPPMATVDVLVAKTDLDTGQTIGEGDVAWQLWPAASANSSFVRKTDRPEAIKDFVGAIVRSPVAAGEPIRDSKVVAAKGGGFMAAILPHGMRAVSVDIAPDTDAGGFILPNDHVDVLLTMAPKGGGNTTVVSDTILTNVRVIAVDQTIGDKDGQKVIIGKTATIEVDPRQANTLAKARLLGTISLALRSLLDSQSPTPEDNQDGGGGINVVRFGVSTR